MYKRQEQYRHAAPGENRVIGDPEEDDGVERLAAQGQESGSAAEGTRRRHDRGKGPSLAGLEQPAILTLLPQRQGRSGIGRFTACVPLADATRRGAARHADSAATRGRARVKNAYSGDCLLWELRYSLRR